jgi:hypothetical protein
MIENATADAAKFVPSLVEQKHPPAMLMAQIEAIRRLSNLWGSISA